MVDTYSPNLALILQDTGTNSGVWGTLTNTNLGTLIEQAISGYVTQAITDGAATVITIPNGATGVARNMTLELTGALTAARVLEVPSNKKLYFIYNNTTGGYAVTVKVSGQTGVSVPNGKKMILVSNGTDIVEAVNYAGTISGGSLTLTGNLSVGGTSGFTGVATFTAQPIMSSLTASQAVFTDGSKGLVSNAITGTGNVVMSASPTFTGTISAAAATLSGNLTLSGGTANGVVYLDGSKIATSGSALTFDGSHLGVVGRVVAATGVFNGSQEPTSGASVEIQYAGGTGYITSYNRTSSQWTDLYFRAGANTIWSVSGSEQMRLTSTGLGIGTSSVSSKLDVVGVNKTNGNEYGTITAWSSDSYAADKGGSIAFWGKYNSSSGNACFGRIYGAKENGTDGSFLGYLGFSTSPGGTPVERMRLDASGNLGLGVTPTNNTLGKTLQVGQAGAWVAESGTNRWWLANNWYFNSGDKYINNGFATLYSQQNGTHQWFTAPSGTARNAIAFTQAMTLDASGNLGIGTTSPAYKLDVIGITRVIGGSASSATFGSNQYIRIDTNANGGYTIGAPSAGGVVTGYYFTSGTTSYAGGLEYQNTANTLTIKTNNTTQATLNSSGNLGLGVTPSGWSSAKAIQIGSGGLNAAVYASSSGVVGLTSNYYFNGSDIYASTGYATRYYQYAGQHVWNTAPSGTAGAAITFTQAMTLDASGVLQVGTTAATGTGNVAMFGAAPSAPTCVVCIGTANQNVPVLQLTNWTGSTATRGPRIVFDNSGIGGFSVGSADGVNAFDIARTWGTPDVRIDSSGNLLVGTSAIGSWSNGSWGVQDMALGGAFTVTAHKSGTASGVAFAYFDYAGSPIGSITQNGTTGVLYNITSDQRLKTNIVNAPDASLIIDSIKVRSFDWLIDGSHQRYGMVAQELLEVAPEAVSVPTDDDEMMGVDYSKLVPILVKEIQSLRARVANLEKL